MLILLIEDDHDLAGNIIDFLELEGIECDFCDRCERAAELMRGNRYDVIVLDIQLPGVDGFTYCQSLRAQGVATPVLMLTARDTVPDKLEGFRAGADDYLVKPFDLHELAARLNVLQRRSAFTPPSNQLTIADLTLDEDTLLVTRGGSPIQINRACWIILRELMALSPRVVTRDRLEFLLWPDGPANPASLKSHVYNLRKAVDEGHSVKLIHTVRNVGLCLKAEE